MIAQATRGRRSAGPGLPRVSVETFLASKMRKFRLENGMRTATLWLLGGLATLAGATPAEARDHCVRANCSFFDSGAAAVDSSSSPDPSFLDPGGPLPRVAAIGSTPGGQTYGRWAAEWWQWVLSLPAATNPIVDTTGANCALGQIDKVWFLAGSGGNESVSRSCTIPSGRSIFFPLINSVFVAFPDDPAREKTERFVRAHSQCTDVRFHEVTVDGVPVANPAQYFTGPSGSPSPLFNALVPGDNFFGLPAGTMTSPDGEQGYYLFLWPLSPGRHTIRWLVTGCTPGAVQDLTYHLTVR